MKYAAIAFAALMPATAQAYIADDVVLTDRGLTIPLPAGGGTDVALPLHLLLEPSDPATRPARTGQPKRLTSQ